MRDKINHNEINKGNSQNIANVRDSKIETLHVGDNIHQEIHDNSVSYEANIEDITNIETLSIYLTTKFKEPNVKLTGAISIIAGLLSIVASLNSIFSGITIIVWLPNFSLTLGRVLLAIGFLLIVFGSLLINALHYKQETKCKNCKKHYAYKEYKNPFVKEVKTHEGTRILTTYYYKCKYCGDLDEKKSSKVINNDENGSGNMLGV